MQVARDALAQAQRRKALVMTVAAAEAGGTQTASAGKRVHGKRTPSTSTTASTPSTKTPDSKFMRPHVPTPTKLSFEPEGS